MIDVALLYKRGCMRDTDTFAWRVMIAREEAGLKQNELVEQLKEYGVEFTQAAYSKIERGSTELPRLAVLLALSKILKVSLHKLLTGEDWQEHVDQFKSQEANEIGAMVDRMQPQTRQVMVLVAQTVLQLEEQLTETQIELIHLLQENIMFLDDDARKKVSSYIDRIGGRIVR